MKLREFSEINLNNLYENFSNYSVTPEEPTAEIPKVGDSIRTNNKKMNGKVLRVGRHDSGYIQVFFKIDDGRIMKAPLDSITIVQKLADEDKDIMENRVKKYMKEFDMSGNGGIKPPINNKPPDDYWGDEDDDDRPPHPKNYLYLTKSYSEMIDDMMNDVRNNSDLYRDAPMSEKRRVIALYNDKKNMQHLIHLFENSGIGAALEFYLTMPLESQSYFRDAWEDHGIDLDGDLEKFGLNEGMMGGINRSAPSTDVSYEKVLDEQPKVSPESMQLLRYQIAEINKKVKMLNDMFIQAKNSKDFSKMDTIKAALSKMARQKSNLTKGYDLE